MAGPFGRDDPYQGYEIQYGPYSGDYIPYKPPKFFFIPGPSGEKYTFTGQEIKELFLSIAVLTFAFAKVLGGWDDLLAYLLPSFIAVFTGFFLHEMGHKFMAQNYGLMSEFRMSMQGLMIALVTSFMGFLIAAPGAVMITGYPTREQSGKTALAGPGVNAAIALIAFPFMFLGGGIAFTATLVVFINSFLGLFNLIPIFPLDGEKIMKWSKLHYAAIVALTGGLFIFALLS